ncbi:universal stress protein [Nannocystis punicea]|uniref:Universal stress protein n=1 Tax=Nannocystis punicea TaxID=2995304 RepID=A0ABY7H6L1_9BACT|nr:universal stress protein [Nannocystis poenicansa]WAS94898.1 universal stress protein [Nannocystis poenicansa]
MNTWIVGVDLRHRSDGAVRFGAWLREQTGGAIELVGVHAAPSAVVDQLDQFEGRVRVHERLKTEAELAMERAGVREAYAEVELVEAGEPAETLASARAGRSAVGMIVGRKAASDGRDLVRLGSVARRLLQRLVVPTFVVPPDLQIDQLRSGPLVVAVTPSDASSGAVEVGATLAKALGRPLVFVRVVSVPEEYTQIYWSTDALAQFKGQTIAAAKDRTAEWLADQGRSEPVVVRYGDTITEILAVAAEQGAPFLVCGSRLLSRVERVIALSTSSELAARAAIPVLVVPPDARP